MKTLNSFMLSFYFILFLFSTNAFGEMKALSEEEIRKVVKDQVATENLNHQFFFNTAIAILGALVVVSGAGMFKLMLDEHRLRKESESILSKAKDELSEKISKTEDIHKKRADVIIKKYDDSLKAELEGFRHRAILYSFAATSVSNEDAVFPAITYLEGKGTIKDLSLLRDLLKNKNISDETKQRIEKAISLVSKRR